MATKAIYSCSQGEVYNISRYAWHSCAEDLVPFQAYKSKYIDAFVADNLAQTGIAEDLPDATARYAPTQLLRMSLVNINDQVLDCFDFLLGYIEDAYKGNPDKIKMMKKTAGLNYLASVKAYHWVSTTNLLSSALQFLVDYKTDLMANKNMPDAFVLRFGKVNADFDEAYKAWSMSDKASYNLTEDKIIATNKIWANLTALLTDAQRVFKKDPSKLDQFTIAFISGQVSGTKAAGVSGKVMIVDTKTGIPNATISIESLDKSVKTDANGRFELSPIAANTYTLKIEAEGYETLIIEKYEVKTGTIGRLKIEMTPIAAKTTATETATA